MNSRTVSHPIGPISTPSNPGIMHSLSLEIRDSYPVAWRWLENGVVVDSVPWTEDDPNRSHVKYVESLAQRACFRRRAIYSWAEESDSYGSFRNELAILAGGILGLHRHLREGGSPFQITEGGEIQT